MKKTKAGKIEKDIIKVAEDRTFGQKNKNKSKQVSQLVKTMAGQEKGGYEKLKNEIYNDKKKKLVEEEEKKLMIDLFAKNVAKGPTTIEEETGRKICQLFKAGLCEKGKRCKNLHDTAAHDPKSDKIDLYTDQRDQLYNNKDDITTWDKAKLDEAVTFNEMKYSNPVKTEKVCEHFLKAVEKKIYGWMWVCPNGFNCHFRHALPHDYVFKSDQVKKEEPKEVDITEVIDKERDKLDTVNLPKVTKAQFEEWAKERRKRIQKERDDRIAEEKRKLGLKVKQEMTGKELFEFKQELFQDDDEAEEVYEREEEPEQEEIKEENHEDSEAETGEKDNVAVDEGLFEDEELPDIAS